TQEFERDGAAVPADVAARRSGGGRSRLVGAAARQGDSVPVFQLLGRSSGTAALSGSRSRTRERALAGRRTQRDIGRAWCRRSLRRMGRPFPAISPRNALSAAVLL